MFGYIENQIARKLLENFILKYFLLRKKNTRIDEGEKYWDLSYEKPFVKDITLMRLEALSEQIYKKGVSAACRAFSNALQKDTQLYDVKINN